MSISLTNLNRDELEDKFFKLKEEHLHLKRESSNEKNQMKYLSVKLSRLINEKKRLLNKEKTKREVELEELIYDFQDKMVQLERENIKLKEKSSLLKTQLDSELFNKKNFKNAYAHVQSKTDSGLGQTRSMNTRTASAIVINRRTPTSPSLRPSTSQTPSSNLKRTPSLPSFAFNLLEEAQEQIKRLQRIVALQQNHIDTLTNSETEQRISKSGYKERHFSIVNYNKSKSTAIEIPGTEHQQNYNVTNNYLSDNNNGEQFKRNQQEVHLQKQFMSSGNQVFNGTKTHQEFQNQNHQFQNQHQHQHHQLIEKMQKELEIERNKSLDLNQKLLQCNVQHNDLEALHQQIQTLEKENEILRNSLEKCIGSCLDDINENNKLTTKNKNSQESKFKDKIINLKKEIKHLKSQLNQEKLKYDQLTQDYQHLQEKYNQMEKQLQSHDNKTDHENYEKLNYCNRSDHRQLKSQLEQMQNERHELLAEFDQMKQALQSFQNSILNQEQDQHDQHGEQDQQDQQDEDLEFNLGSNDDT